MSTDMNNLDDASHEKNIQPLNWLTVGATVGFAAATDSARRALAFYNYQKDSQDAQGFSIIGGIVTGISLVTAVMSLVDGIRNRTPAVDQVRVRLKLRNLTLFPLVLYDLTLNDSRLGFTPIIPSGESVEFPLNIAAFSEPARMRVTFAVGDTSLPNQTFRDFIEVHLADYGGDSFLRVAQVRFLGPGFQHTTNDPVASNNRHHTRTDVVFYRSSTMSGPASYTVYSNTITNGAIATLELTVLGSVQ